MAYLHTDPGRPRQSFFSKLFNPVFLLHKAKRVAENWYWDWRFGGSCAGVVAPLSDRGAVQTQGQDYEQLALLFNPRKVPIAPSDVLVDVGCGKGRVINYWLRLARGNRIIGIELNEKVARPTRERLRPYANVTIIHGDVLQHIPAEATLFYLFHPFEQHVMRQFKDRLEELFGKRGNVTIVYCNCLYLDLFENDPLWSIDSLDHRSLDYKSAIIRMNDPANAAGSP